MVNVSDFKQRSFFSAIAIAILFVVIFLSSWSAFKIVFTFGIAAIVAVGVWEYFQLAKAIGKTPDVAFGVVVSVCLVFAMFLGTQYSSWSAAAYVVFACAVLLSFVPYVFGKRDDALINIAVTLFGIVYVAYNMALLIRIRYFSHFDSLEYGCWWLVYLLVVTKITDIGGLLAGRFLGKHKLAERLSPKKTWEGAVGGFICAVIASWAMSLIGQELGLGSYILSSGEALLLGGILSIVGQFGDLAESLLKRNAGIKDSNNIPGLGGMLDMLDSLLFTIPVVYIVMRIKF